MCFIRRLFLLICCALCAQMAESAPIRLKGKEVHPTRIIAKLKAQGVVAQAAAVGTTGLKVRKQPGLVPRLMVFDLADQKAATALAQTATENQAQELQTRIDALRQTGLYEYVEPDYIVHATLTPNDSKFVDGTLWGLRNTGQNGGVAGVDAGTVQAWDVTTGSTNVIIAVIDSGIRYTHQDLAAQMWHNPGETAGNSVDDDHDGYIDDVFGINAITGSGNPMDDDDHGTHVAGTIGAAANDGNPIVGVCWHVQLMACKFLDATGTGATSDAIECINYAVAHGARILNNSWGGEGYSQGLADAISAAGAHGALFVAAAGNGPPVDNDASPFYPASYALDNVIAVAAIDRTDQLASFSHYGRQTVHLGAPGVSIYSSTSGSDSEYKTFDGTSMATPHVSGVAGLVLAQFPNLTVSNLKDRLLNTAVVTPALLNTTVSGGRVNAYNALTATPSGNLQVQLSTDNGGILLAGRPGTIYIRVNDLISITNATTTGSRPGLAFFNFTNKPNDAVYSAVLTVPTGTNSIPITVMANASGKIGVTNTFNVTIITPPSNDYFTNATLVSGTGVSVTGSNLGASKEAGEPVITTDGGVDAGGRSVWWTWTAPADGLVSIDTEGSSIDTILGVYTGNAVNSLSQVATNDDVSTNDYTSAVSFQTLAGVTYQIVVDGFDAAYGDITLNLSLDPSSSAPANDLFANRSVISGITSTVSGSNIGASREPSEPLNGGGKSVWWTWTAPGNGQTTISTAGSSFDTILGVYLGNAVNALTLVAYNDDDPPFQTSLVTFDATAGTAYQIAVDGFGGASGSITLSVNFSGTPTAPTNDLFANRTTITGASNSVNGYNIGATKETGEPDHAGNLGGASVWWTWRAPNSEPVYVKTAGSSFNTLLGVYTGSTVSTLTGVASDINSGTNGSSLVTFTPVLGTAYQIAVDGVNNGPGAATGTIVLTLAPVPIFVTNDLFAHRINITGNSNTVHGSNIDATVETGEPLHAGRAGGASVWWNWTPTVSGQATVSTVGSSFDTLLGIYTGNTVTNLTPVASDDDSGGNGTSLVSFHVVAGTPYRIAVDGGDGATGNIVLGVNLAPSPANDLFAHAISLPGNSDTVHGSNIAATLETGEPFHAGNGGGSSVWWTWTPTISGQATVSTAGSSFDTVLGIYTGTAVSNLIEVASNDDGGGSDGTSLAVFHVTAGTPYRIAVDGFNGAQGAIVLNVSLVSAPANDLFAHAQAITLTGNYAIISGTTFAAGKEAGEPNHAGEPGGASVWWTWRAPKTGPAMIQVTSATVLPALAVYTGTVISNLTLITSDNSSGIGTPGQPGLGFNGSIVYFQAAAGVTYRIAVDQAGLNGNVGDPVKLTVALSPPNALFANRISLAGTSPTATGDNVGAPVDLAEDNGFSVWWTWIAPSNGVASLTTDGSNFDTALEVFTGSDPANLAGVATNLNDSFGTNSTVVFNATAGTPYQIKVYGENGSWGNIILKLRLFTQPPTITMQPVGARTATNSAVRLSVTATGTTPLTYQWSLNGSDLPGATNSFLSFAHVQFTNSGSYVVVVSNPKGAATSSDAVLEVVQEIIKPIVTITSGPAANGRTTSPAVQFQGNATDKAGVAQVLYQFNGGDFTLASGTAPWFASGINIPGTNTFVVKAVDVNTNESLPVTRKYFYSVTNGLTLTTNLPGMGTIARSFTGTNLEIGRGYTVTATAKTGFLFSNWDGTITGTKAALNFLMQQDMELQANFVTNPFIAIKGIYNGLYSDDTGFDPISSGSFTFTLGDSGTYSGKIWINGSNYPFAGSFDLYGQSTATVTRPKTNAVTIALQLNLGAQDDKVSGTVSDGLWLAEVDGDRAVFNATTNKATNFMGSFTMSIQGGADVGGAGYATLTIDAAGTIRMIGKLGENTALSQSATLSKDGRWPLYVSLYSGQGCVLGWMTFSNQPATIFGGSLNWAKPTLTNSLLYPAAFAGANDVIGSVFQTPKVSTNLLVSFGNGSMILSGGNLTDSISNSVTVNPTSVAVSGTNHVTLTLNRTSGLVSGSFIHPDLHRTITLTGVVLQQQNIGSGFFLGTNQSGSFSVQSP